MNIFISKYYNYNKINNLNQTKYNANKITKQNATLAFNTNLFNT